MKVRLLRSAVAAADPIVVRQSVHRLRGESAALGAVDVARLCGTLEDLSIEGTIDGAPALVAAIEAAFGRAAAALREVTRIRSSL